jgi:hypothetical protein
VGLPGPPRLVLTDGQWRTEHILLAWLAREHRRVVEPADSRVTTDYVNRVADNSRLLSGGNPRLHLNLLRHMVRRLRSLPVGSDGL